MVSIAVALECLCLAYLQGANLWLLPGERRKSSKRIFLSPMCRLCSPFCSPSVSAHQPALCPRLCLGLSDPKAGEEPPREAVGRLCRQLGVLLFVLLLMASKVLLWFFLFLGVCCKNKQKGGSKKQAAL